MITLIKGEHRPTGPRGLPLWDPSFLILCVAVVLAAPLGKTAICHKGVDIAVSDNSLAAHLAHGDTLGTCGDARLPALA